MAPQLILLAIFLIAFTSEPSSKPKKQAVPATTTTTTATTTTTSAEGTPQLDPTNQPTKGNSKKIMPSLLVFFSVSNLA